MGWLCKIAKENGKFGTGGGVLQTLARRYARFGNDPCRRRGRPTHPSNLEEIDFRSPHGSRAMILHMAPDFRYDGPTWEMLCARALREAYRHYYYSKSVIQCRPVASHCKIRPKQQAARKIAAKEALRILLKESVTCTRTSCVRSL